MSATSHKTALLKQIENYFVITEEKTIHIMTSKMSKPELTCSVLYPASLVPRRSKVALIFRVLGNEANTLPV